MRAAAIALVLAGLVMLAAPALAFVPADGRFTAERACEAPDSLRRGTNPGDVRVREGSSYPVLGLNATAGAWVRIRVAGASPADRWVERGCGRLEVTADGAPHGALLPFFDSRLDGPNDPTPAPPRQGPFDEAMLEVCGAWGSRPQAGRFRSILDRTRIAPDVREIHRALEGRVVGEPLELEPFKDELTRVWFAAEGFRHVFCGEPGEDGLGGLHYRGRLLELQQAGIAGLATAERCRATAIDPPVYAIGVRYRRPDGGLGLACPKSYALDQDAKSLLVTATSALRSAVARDAGRMCLAEVEASPARSYMAVLVRRGDAIVTFYPDAMPRCDRGGAPRQCLCDEHAG